MDDGHRTTHDDTILDRGREILRAEGEAVAAHRKGSVADEGVQHFANAGKLIVVHAGQGSVDPGQQSAALALRCGFLAHAEQGKW